MESAPGSPSGVTSCELPGSFWERVAIRRVTWFVFFFFRKLGYSLFECLLIFAAFVERIDFLKAFLLPLLKRLIFFRFKRLVFSGIVLLKVYWKTSLQEANGVFVVSIHTSF